jgi:ribonuclease HI
MSISKSKVLPIYAVAIGKECNVIVNTWDECKSLVTGFKGAKYKKFSKIEDAKEYLCQHKDDKVKSQSSDMQDAPRTTRKSDEHTTTTIIYTDGSLVRRQCGIYAGFGIYAPSKNFEISRVLRGKKTNNRAELTAIISSIKMFKEDDNVEIHIYTDSQYSIGIFGSTGIKYRASNYMKKGTTEVPNADLVKTAVLLGDTYLLKFTHINSHTSAQDEHSKGNDRADKLAVRGAVYDYTERCKDLGESVLTFGKYKNIMLKNIPTSYLSWIITSDSFEEICVKNEDRRLEKEIVITYMGKQ